MSCGPVDRDRRFRAERVLIFAIPSLDIKAGGIGTGLCGGDARNRAGLHSSRVGDVLSLAVRNGAYKEARRDGAGRFDAAMIRRSRNAFSGDIRRV